MAAGAAGLRQANHQVQVVLSDLPPSGKACWKRQAFHFGKTAHDSIIVGFQRFKGATPCVSSCRHAFGRLWWRRQIDSQLQRDGKSISGTTLVGPYDVGAEPSGGVVDEHNNGYPERVLDYRLEQGTAGACLPS
jgi:hypothetical protein